MTSSEQAVVGLFCILVGVFFLANSIIFQRTRRVIDQFFHHSAGSLATIRDYSLNKIQVIIGFLFLATGFIMQLFAFLEDIEGKGTVLLAGVLILVAGFVVYMIGATYSRRSFRRYLREFFKKNPWSFSENMAVTKEIGMFLGIHKTEDMTVDEFVHQVKKALDVPAKPQVSERRGMRDISWSR